MAESRERRRRELLLLLLRRAAAEESVAFASPARQLRCLRSWLRRERSRARPPRTRKGALGPFEGGIRPKNGGRDSLCLVRLSRNTRVVTRRSSFLSKEKTYFSIEERWNPVAFSLSLSRLSPESPFPIPFDTASTTLPAEPQSSRRFNENAVERKMPWPFSNDQSSSEGGGGERLDADEPVDVHSWGDGETHVRVTNPDGFAVKVREGGREEGRGEEREKKLFFSFPNRRPSNKPDTQNPFPPFSLSLFNRSRPTPASTSRTTRSTRSSPPRTTTRSSRRSRRSLIEKSCAATTSSARGASPSTTRGGGGWGSLAGRSRRSSSWTRTGGRAR